MKAGKLAAGAGILILASVLIGYYVMHKPFEAGLVIAMVRNVQDLAVALGYMLVASGLGRRLLAQRSLGGLEGRTIEAGLGLGSLALGMLALGAIGVLQSGLIAALLVAGLFLLRMDVLAWGRAGLTDLRGLWQDGGKLERLLFLFSAGILFLSFLQAAAPPWQFDSLVYHLALPQEFLNTGRLAFVPDNPFWGMPLGAEMNYAAVMALGRLEAAALLGWLVALLTLLGLTGLCRRLDIRGAGVAAPILLAGGTLAASTAWAYVDWWAALYGLCAFLLLAVPGGSDSRPGLAGLFAGFAIGVKYTAGASAIAAAVLVLDQSIRQRRAGGAVRFAMLALVATAPWLAKNWLATGALAYPFFGTTPWVDSAQQAQYQAAADPLPPQEALFVPVIATLLGVEGAPGLAADIGPLLLGLSPASLLLARRSGLVRAALLYFAAGWIVWSVAAASSGLLGQSRLYFSLFPVWAFLGSAGFAALYEARLGSVRLGRLAAALVLLALAFSFAERLSQTVRSNPLPVLFNQESRSAYLFRNLGAYLPAAEAARAQSSARSVLMLWEPRGLYCAPGCSPDVWLDTWYLARGDGMSWRQITASWRSQGVDYLLLNQAGMRFIRETDARYAASDWEELTSMIAELEPVQVFSDLYTLYRLP